MGRNIAHPENDVSPDFPFTLHCAKVLGLEMAYVDTRPEEASGRAPTALFLHGNPTSSYIWRNVIPHVSPTMRCVAPDLIGMGASSKPRDLSYRFTDHYTFLSAFISRVIPSGAVLLVMQDWGSALGFHWAYQQCEAAGTIAPPRLLGLAFMEFVRPFPTIGDLTEATSVQELFTQFRDPVRGRKLIIEENMFIEQAMPSSTVRALSETELDHYRKPFIENWTREPVFVWPGQIPIAQTPSDVYDISTRYYDWLLQCSVPKLLFWGTPGRLVTPQYADWCKVNLKNTSFVHLGQGLHYLQEDHPDKLGQELMRWARRLMYSE